MEQEYPDPPPADLQCILTGTIPQFIWKWTVCSWAHRWRWTTLNKLGGYKRVKVSGHCNPHVWHECSYWHCDTCHPCDEGLDFMKAQKPIEPGFAKIINDKFWELL